MTRTLLVHGRRHRPAAWTTAAILSALVGAASCGGHEGRAPAATATPVTVDVVRVALTDTAGTYEAGGTVQPRVSATLTSRVMAPVHRVTVNPGDLVRAGQTLIELDTRDLTAGAQRAAASAQAAEYGAQAARSEQEAADAALVLSEATRARVSRLHERKSATVQELDEANAALRAAQSRAASARARISEADAALAGARAASEAADVTAAYGLVRAPFAGLVTEKLIEPGNMAAPGTPLLRLESRDAPRVEVRLDESRATWVSPGQAVTVQPGGAAASSQERSLQGRVAEVARAIDADARSFLVKVDLPAAAASDPAVRSGMFARVIFDGPSRKALLVPRSAVVERGQVATLFVVEESAARLRIVRTGTRIGPSVEILAGLDPGEQVVVAPSPALVDRQAVRTTGRVDGEVRR
jgi:RND family efflux transporter MFP subunit